MEIAVAVCWAEPVSCCTWLAGQEPFTNLTDKTKAGEELRRIELMSDIEMISIVPNA